MDKQVRVWLYLTIRDVEEPGSTTAWKTLVEREVGFMSDDRLPQQDVEQAIRNANDRLRSLFKMGNEDSFRAKRMNRDRDPFNLFVVHPPTTGREIRVSVSPLSRRLRDRTIVRALVKIWGTPVQAEATRGRSSDSSDILHAYPYPRELVLHLLRRWQEAVDLWATIRLHEELAPKLMYAKTCAEIVDIENEIDRRTQEFWDPYADFDPPFDKLQVFEQAIAHLESKRERLAEIKKAACRGERELVSPRTMQVVFKLMIERVLQLEGYLSLAKLSRQVAGLPNEIQLSSDQKSRRVSSVRSRTRERLRADEGCPKGGGQE